MSFGFLSFVLRNEDRRVGVRAQGHQPMEMYCVDAVIESGCRAPPLEQIMLWFVCLFVWSCLLLSDSKVSHGATSRRSG
jgi:hypothetical protein